MINSSNIVKAVANFISDERGAESVEFGVTSVVVAGGAVRGLTSIQGAVKSKQTTMVSSLSDATTGE